MRRVAGVLLLAACAIDACDSSTFVAGDASTDANDDVPGIGGDGGASDGSAPKEASVETHYCDGVDAQFCSDFDEPDATGRWIEGFESSGAWTIEIESMHASSPPNGLEVDLAVEAGTAWLADLMGDGDAGPSTMVSLDLDMTIPPLSGPFAPVLLFAMGCPLGGISTHFGLAYGAGVWSLASEGGGPVATMSGTVPTTTSAVFAHVTMNIVLGVAGSVSLSINHGAATAASATPINTVGQTALHYPIELRLGVDNSAILSPSGPVYFDNVVVRYQ